ncbi:MAG TPA: hypothetical protein VJH37_01845 [Candidatus Nanoarchaeia archaeon]|nr:hypothetical protein [Candidatus Nanoarchaeia archaeon]
MNRLRLLEHLSESLINLETLDSIADEKEYEKVAYRNDRILGLMRTIYESVKKIFPEAPIVKSVERSYSDAWDVMCAPAYGHNIE